MNTVESQLSRFREFLGSPGHCGKTAAAHHIRIYMPVALLKSIENSE
jgi:hypothetical protein